MNKPGIWLNVILTIVGIAGALSVLPQFSHWVADLLVATVVGNVIIHIWFPGVTPPTTPA